MAGPPLVSIIILNYNGKRFLKECIASVEKSRYKNTEVIFVDNASEDNSVEFVKKQFPSARIIINNTNLGFSQANNQATKTARGQYVFFLNNDTRLDSQAISKMVEKMEKEKNVGICGCQIKSIEGQKCFHCGIGMDIFGYPITLKNKIFYIEGAALMIRKQLFKAVMGFDSSYFMFHEDVDLAWRVWLFGFQVAAEKKAIVYHWGGGTAGGTVEYQAGYKTSLLRRYFSEKNNLRTLLKNYSWPFLPPILLGHLLINFGEIFLYLLALNVRASLVYPKAYWWNLINLHDTLSRRKSIQKKRVISDLDLMKKMYWGSGKLFALRILGMPVIQGKSYEKL